MFKLKAYKIILKVRKFQLPTYYWFSTAEGEIWMWVNAAPPGLNKVKLKFLKNVLISQFSRTAMAPEWSFLDHIDNSAGMYCIPLAIYHNTVI